MTLAEYSSEPIIPGVTECGDFCKLAEITGPLTLCIDADCMNYGRPLLCPNHQDMIIYVFGTDWWKEWNGPCAYGGNTTPPKKLWCGKCNSYWVASAWSYGG